MKISVRSVRSIFLATAVSLGLSGCGLQWFISPKENPVISDPIDGGPGEPRHFEVLSNTPERRMMVFNVTKGHSRFGKFCSEAPADAGESLSSSLTAALEATKQDTEVSAEAAKTLATALQSLTPRSQGVVLFRDAAYFNCQLYMNEIIGGPDLVQSMHIAFETAKELILKELEENDGKIGYGPLPSIGAPPRASLSESDDDEEADEEEG